MPAFLSAILIARDEERDLPGALESLRGLASELVVVVGAASRDKTEAIARKAGAKVLIRAFDGYASQKQAALELATSDWVLSLDADERVSPALRDEVKSVLASGVDAAGFEIPFRVFFLGRRLRWGGLGSEKHLRLFRRSKARFVGGSLHEGVEVEGPVERLKAPINHEPYRDLSEYLAKLDAYTTLAARKRRAQGQRFKLWHHLILPWEFFVRAFLKLGLLDGQAGLVWAGLSAFHAWLKYVKLKELENTRDPRDTAGGFGGEA